MKVLFSVILFLVVHSFSCLGEDGPKAVYHLIPPVPVNHLFAGTILGLVNDADNNILFAGVSKGKLPEGVFQAEDGTLVVTKPELLKPGTYQFTIVTADDANTVSEHNLTITFLEPGASNISPVGKISREKLFDEYQRDDVLAEIVDRDGEIVETKVVRGKLPLGTELSQNGQLKIINSTFLFPGTYDFWVLAVDSQHQGRFLALTVKIPIEERIISIFSDSSKSE